MRNHLGQKVFERFLKRAVGPQVNVVTAHHIIFVDGDLSPNEIPSADSLCFDYVLMERVFGEQSKIVMMTLCHRPPELREKVLKDFLDELDKRDADLQKTSLQA